MFRFVRTLVVLAILGFVGFKLAVRWIESTSFFKERLQSEIALRFEGDVDVGDAMFRFFDRVLVATDIALKDRRAGEPQIVIPEIAVKLPYSIVDSGGRVAPERVVVRGGVVRLVERGDGTFAPLDLIKVAGPTMPIPAVAIEDGSVVLSGDGPLDALLDGILRPDLPRRVANVRLASAPMPETSDYLIGFNGNLELPGLAPVTLFGGFGRDNSMRLELELRDLDLANTHLHEMLSPAISDQLARHVIGGKVTLEVKLDLAAAVGAPARIRIDMHAHDLVLRHRDYFSRDIAGVSVDATFDGRNFRLHEARIPDRGGVLAIDGVIENVVGDDALAFDDFRFTFRGADISFRDSLAGDLKEPMLRGIIDDFDPDGHAEFFLELSRSRGGTVRPRWSLKPLDATASYVGHVLADGSKTGFPYRVTALRGEISGDGPMIEIRHLRGQHAGFGLVDIDGTIDARGVHTGLDLRVVAHGAPTGDGKLRDALEHVSPGAGEIVDRFAPRGTIDADVRVWVDPETNRTHREGVVTARSLDAEVVDFPFPLHFERGSVAFDDDRYTIRRLEAEAGAMKVTIDGEVEVVAGQVGIGVGIEVVNARAQDPVLRRAFDAMIARHGDATAPPPFEFSWLEPAGGFDATVELRQEPGDAMHFSAMLFPRDLRAVPKWFAIPFEGVLGRVEFGTLDPDTGAPRPLSIELDDLRGKYRGAEVTLRGAIDGESVALDVRGSSVPVTEELIAALESAVADDPTPARHAAREIVDGLRPAGKVSFGIHLPGARGAAGGKPANGRVDLQFEGTSIANPMVPGGGIEGLRGRIGIDLERSVADGLDLQGNFDRGCGRVAARNVELRSLGDTFTLAGDLELRDLPLDERSASWMGPSIAKQLAPTRGVARVASREFEAVFDSTGEAMRVRANDVELALAGASFLEPLAIDSLEATAAAPRLTFAAAGGRSALDFDSKVELTRGVVSGLEVIDAGADVTVGRDRIAIERLRAGVVGGRVNPTASRIEIDRGAVAGVRGRVQFADGDLTTLFAQLGVAGSETRGRFDLDLELGGTALTLAALTGQGNVKIRDGRLADIPWIALIYRRTLGYVLGEWFEPTFSSGEIRFERNGDRIRLPRIRLDSMVSNLPVGLRLTGDGELGTTGIDLRIVPEIVRTDDRFLIAPLLRFLTRPLFSYRVTGPLRNPRVQYRNLAMEYLMPLTDDTNRPRLIEPRTPTWSERF